MMTEQTIHINIHKEQGSTLVVVLFLLLIIMIVGTYAIKTGITSLRISTNAQINQLLTQAADTPLNKYLNTVDLTRLMSYSTAVGAAIDETAPNREFIFCYKPRVGRVFGSIVDTSVIAANETEDGARLVDSGINGLCDLTQDFGSARQAVVTQVAITIPRERDPTKQVGSHLVRGTNLSIGSGLPKNLISSQAIRVTTTAFLPAYANTTITNLQAACLSSNNVFISDNLSAEMSTKRTLKDCLMDFNVPVVSQVQEFNLASFLEQTVAP
ncbi:PilX N-terminal domain-containing pilus assembly protein [Acinetobacter indicus]|uniref:PilX N-terminal domain-containing pilus assembly protein n=2 Tax=Acinetobacter indicus TaxID=756892 RepID=UPI0035BC23B6